MVLGRRETCFSDSRLLMSRGHGMILRCLFNLGQTDFFRHGRLMVCMSVCGMLTTVWPYGVPRITHAFGSVAGALMRGRLVVDEFVCVVHCRGLKELAGIYDGMVIVSPPFLQSRRTWSFGSATKMGNRSVLEIYDIGDTES